MFCWITGKYQIITFEEYILIALYANRAVGIYPEIKNPVFINQHVSSIETIISKKKTFVYFWYVTMQLGTLELKHTSGNSIL
jgi:restriction endonuclease S subunit